MVRVGLLGGEPLELRQIVEWVGELPGVRCVGPLSTEGLRRQPSRGEVDVLIGLFSDPDDPELEFARRLIEDDQRRRLVAVLGRPSGTLIAAAAARGADAIVAARSGAEAFERALTAVTSGAAWLDPALSDHVLAQMPSVDDAPRPFDLTPQEYRVGLLIGEGLTRREMGAQMRISEQTVKTHISNLYKKLDVNGRSAAAKKLREARMPVNGVGSRSRGDSGSARYARTG